MLRTLIIGYGNPLRGDDAIGHHAAKRLGDMLPRGMADIVTCQQLTPELAERMGGYGRVVFIDASTGDIPGVVRVKLIDRSELKEHPLSHHVAPESVLCYCEHLHGFSPAAHLVTMTSDSFGYTEGLSDSVLEGMSELVNAVVAVLNQKVPVEGTKRKAKVT